MASPVAWCKARAALDECLGAGALSAEDVAALAAVSRSQSLTATELACSLALSKAKAARLLRRLIDFDLVAERVSPRDRRRSLLRMTSRGENILFEVGHSLDGAVLDMALTGMRALREAARAASAFDAPLAPGQSLLLMVCHEQEALGVGDAAKLLGCAQPSVSMAARQLAARDLLAVRASSHDRRRHCLALTSRGISVVARALRAWNATWEQ